MRGRANALALCARRMGWIFLLVFDLTVAGCDEHVPGSAPENIILVEQSCIDARSGHGPCTVSVDDAGRDVLIWIVGEGDQEAGYSMPVEDARRLAGALERAADRAEGASDG